MAHSFVNTALKRGADLEIYMSSFRKTNLIALLLLAGSAIVAPSPGFADEKKVLAKVGGVEVTEAEVALAASDLDPQFSKLPPEQQRLAAIAALIDIKAMALKGAEAKLNETDAFKTRMSFLHDRALHNAYFEKEVLNKITGNRAED